jgi:REP element-mobilizing transposase RayT
VVLGGEMTLNKLGEIANDGWRWLEKKFPGFGIPVFCVMPNHAHAVITIEYKSKTRRGGVTPPNQGEGEVTSPLRQPTLDK